MDNIWQWVSLFYQLVKVSRYFCFKSQWFFCKRMNNWKWFWMKRQPFNSFFRNSIHFISCNGMWFFRKMNPFSDKRSSIDQKTSSESKKRLTSPQTVNGAENYSINCENYCYVREIFFNITVIFYYIWENYLNHKENYWIIRAISSWFEKITATMALYRHGWRYGWKCHAFLS